MDASYVSKLVGDIEELVRQARSGGRRQVRLCQNQMLEVDGAPFHATDAIVESLVSALRGAYPRARMQFDGRQCGYVVVVDF